MPIFSHLLSMSALFLWVNPARACVNLASADASVSSALRWFDVGLFTGFLLTLSVCSALLLLLIYLIRKFVLKKASTWADLCWPAALINLLLLGGIGIFFIPALGGFFAEFGAELPAPTLFIMAIPPVLWVLPFVAALVFKGIAQPPRLSVWLPIQLVSFFSVATLLWALYLPIFGVHAVV